MMGMPLPPEERARIDELVAQRKEKVAASLGKTVEEFEEAQHAGHGHDGAHDRAHDDPADDLPESDVDEEAVLAFIRTRQEVIERQRGRIRSLEAEVRHLESKNELAERKIAALRDALAKLRAEAKEARGKGVAAPEAHAPRPGQGE